MRRRHFCPRPPRPSWRAQKRASAERERKNIINWRAPAGSGQSDTPTGLQQIIALARGRPGRDLSLGAANISRRWAQMNAPCNLRQPRARRSLRNRPNGPAGRTGAQMIGGRKGASGRRRRRTGHVRTSRASIKLGRPARGHSAGRPLVWRPSFPLGAIRSSAWPAGGLGLGRRRSSSRPARAIVQKFNELKEPRPLVS